MMAKSTHTPGPWETIKRCTGFYDIGIPEKHREAGRQHWIATVWSRDEKHDFNARLIAEAPAMLEALRKAERFLEGFEDAGDLLDDPIDDDLAEIRAILARIDGEAAQ